MYQLSLSIRPNNQVTLTQGQYKGSKKEVYKTVSQSKPDSLKLRRALSAIKPRTAKQGLRSDMKPYEKPSRPTLDITKKSQETTEPTLRRGFGLLPKPKSFTNASGQKLRECGAAIDHSQPCLAKTHCVTLTLPCGTDDSFRNLAAHSSFVINRLFQPIRDNYGESCLWFFVWEYQKRGALHLHIAVSHDTHGEAKKIGDILIKTWIDILMELSETTGICMFTSRKGDRCTLRKFWQMDNQAMQKGLGRYFSKYAGKQESKKAWYCQKYPVSRFWGSCYALKRIIKSMSLSLKFDFENCELMDEYATDIIDKLLSICKIAAMEQYQFQVNIGSDRSPYIVADGERSIFYIFPDMLMELKNQMESRYLVFEPSCEFLGI